MATVRTPKSVELKRLEAASFELSFGDVRWR